MQDRPSGTATRSTDSLPSPRATQLARLAWLSLVVLVAAVVFFVLRPSEVAWNSPVLLLALNTLCLASVSFLVTILAGQSYLAGHGKAVLLLGCGTLALGLGAILAGLPPGKSDFNYTATVYNSAALLASVCHLVGACWGWRHSQEPQRPTGSLMAVLYPGVVVLIVFGAAAVRERLLPGFFIEGSGATPINRAVLWTASALFGLSVLLLWGKYRKVRSTFLRWYAIGLTMLVVGLMAVSLQKGFGTPLNWLGRASQYLGGIYMLVAVVSAARQGRGWTLTLETALRQSEDRLRTLYESGLLGVIYWNMTGQITDANDKFLQMVGYDREDLAAGRIDWAGMTPQEYRHLDEQSMVELKASGANKVPFEKAYIRKDGTRIPVLVAGVMLDDARIDGVAFVLDITQRKAAEEELDRHRQQLEELVQERTAALRKSQVLLNETQRISKVGGWEFDVAAGRVFWTDEVYRIHGVSKDYDPGNPDQDIRFYAPEDQQRIADAFALAVAQGVPYDLELQLVTAQGKGLWVRTMGQAERRDGRVVRVSGNIMDVTERKRAEEALREANDLLERRVAERTAALQESEDRLSFALQTIQTGAWDLDLVDHTAFRSLEHDRIFGYDELLPEWTYGMFLNHVLPEDRPAVDAQFRRAMETKGDWNFECRIRRADGAIRWITAAGRHRPNAAGVLRRMAGVVQDITTRKQAEEALAAAHRQLQSVIDNTPSMVYACDLEARFVMANAALAALLGTTPAQMLGKRRREFMPQEDADKHEANDREVMAAGRAVEFEEHSELPGRSITWLSTKFPLRDAQGRIYAIAGIVTDISARKQAEVALRQSEERLRLAQQAARIGTFEWNIQTDRDVWSLELESLYGLRPGEFAQTAAAWSELVHPEDRANVLRLSEQSLQTGQPTEGEWRVIWPDGSVHWLAGRWQVFKDDSGKPLRMTGVNLDISDRKRAEEELRRSHERMKRVLEVETVGVMFWDLNTGVMVDANDTFLKLMGYSRSDVEAGELNWQKLTPPEYMEVSRAEVRKFMATGRVGPYEKEYFRKDGTRQWLLFAGSSLGNNQCVEFCVDISAQKKAQEALKQNEEEYAAIFERSVVGKAQADLATGRFTRVNQALADMTGYSADELCRLTFADLTHPEDRPRDAEAFGAAVSGQTDRWQIEKRYVRKDGAVIWVSVAGNIIRYEDGRPAHSVAVIQDITARRLAEDALGRAMEELQRSNKELEHFAYISSHDLQEPLRQVMSFGNLLTQRYASQLDEKGKQYIAYMAEGSQRMSNLVRALLDYSRVGKPGQDVEPVSAEDALDGVLLNMKATVEECGAHVKRDKLPTVLAHPVELGQLFQNLIGNALKFRREGVKPEVHVGCCPDGRTCTFSVKDNGIGIPPDLHEKAFVVFQRLHGQGKYPGTGIGLAICKKIVERHGGRIWIESAVGEGSTFFFTMPLAKEAQA